MAKKVVKVNVKSPKGTANKKSAPVKVRLGLKETSGVQPKGKQKL